MSMQLEDYWSLKDFSSFLLITHQLFINFLLWEMCYSMDKLTLRRPSGEGRGGGDLNATPNRRSQFCWEWGELFLQSNFFSCRLILGTSVHEKNFQMETAILALKLDKGKVLEVANPPPPPPPSIEQKFTNLSSHEYGIQLYKILVWSKIVFRCALQQYLC